MSPVPGTTSPRRTYVERGIYRQANDIALTYR
jgi:hypothetical protein